VPTQLIVLVEDNPDDEAMTLRALQKQNLGHDIVVLRDGVEALEFLLSPDQPLPHLVLLDLNLPKVDGLTVLQRLRSEPRTQLLPIVVLTSSRGHEHAGRVSPRRQQLHLQARGLPPVLRGRAPSRFVLAGYQPGAAPHLTACTRRRATPSSWM